MRPMLFLPILVTFVALAGCVNVAAPEKPIEINLNINVKQEVIVRLQKDAQDLIDKNPELFPQ
jgi:lipoprotein NlpI